MSVYNTKDHGQQPKSIEPHIKVLILKTYKKSIIPNSIHPSPCLENDRSFLHNTMVVMTSPKKKLVLDIVCYKHLGYMYKQNAYSFIRSDTT